MVRLARALLALAAVAAVATPTLYAGNRLSAVPDIGAADEELVAPLRGSWAVGVISLPEADRAAARHASKRMGAWGGAALVAALAGLVLAGRWSRNLGWSSDCARRLWWRPGSLQRAPPLAPRF